MAIYQPPTKRWRSALVAAVLALLAGLVIGATVLGGAEPDPAQTIRELDTELDGAANVLTDVFVVEYADAVEDGRTAELAGATGALSRARARYRTVRDAAREIDRDAVRAIDSVFDDLAVQVEDRAVVEDVERGANLLARLLRNIVTG